MSLTDYYISKYDGSSYERTFFLKFLQAKGSSGGGQNLLGSIVPYVSGGIFGLNYVVPELYYPTPNILVPALAPFLAAGVQAIQTIQLAGVTITMTRSNDDIVDLTAGPFPSLPVSLGIDFEYKNTDSISLTFGAGTVQQYIPLGLLAQLYASVKGTPTPAIGGSALADQAIVDSVLYASNYSISVQSSNGFTSALNASVTAAANALPVGGKISFTSNTTNSITAQVSGTDPYLVALSRELWDSFDLS